jgi:hypothetical protein
MALSYADLMGYWVKAGGSEESAPLAAAIALAESGGNPTAHNAVPPDDSYGPWQINMLGSMGQQRAATFGLRSYSDLYDPLTNAKAAVAISSGGTNFVPWSTYTSGAYRDYLQGGVPPNLNVTGGGGTVNVGFPSASDITASLWMSITLIGNYIFFALVIGGGVVMLYLGLMLLVRETSGGQAIIGTGKAIKKVIPGV